MNSAATLLLGLLVALQAGVVGKVESTADKKVNFAALRTYAWTTGANAFNPDAHKMIVAAFETEMASLGFTKVATSPDVTLAYRTITITHVDLKAADKVEREGRGGDAPTKALGRLVVIMRSAATNQEVWSASTREFVDPDPAKLSGTIQSVTTSLFNTYPGRKPAR